MHRLLLAIVAAALLQVGLANAAQPARGVSLASLLAEMTDRAAVARWPEPAYRTLQASSWDRAAQKDGQPHASQGDEGWFANADFGKYVREEQRQGRTEKVMMDAQGPGAIVRIWSANPDRGGTLRIYLDGSDKPVIEENFKKLTDGTGLISAPLSAVRARGHNLYLPIPYARSCKVTLDGDPENRLYYIINHRRFDDGTQVQTFTASDLERHRGLLEQAQQQLLEWPETVPWPGAKTQATGGMASPLAAGDSVEIEVDEGPGAVYELSVTVSLDRPESADAVSRALVLEAFADGQRRVNAPIGDFFGSGVGFNVFQDRYRRVVVEKGEATLTSRWVMPFRESMRIRLTNRGEQAVEVAVSAAGGAWEWDDRSMYFHANFRQQRDIHTRPRQDLNYLTVEGRGVYVGDTLAVANPTPAWWGEGDEKVYIDREPFPSHFGTGTEDYYGYAWCCPDAFTAPFHSQPRADGPDNFGHVTNSRVRALDAIPFAEHLKFDMEVWHWHEVDVSYATTAFWYGMPDATAVGAVAEAELDTTVPELPRMTRLEGVIEGEALVVAGKSADFPVARQMLLNVFEGDWSNGGHLWIQASEPGQHVDLKLPTAEAKAQTLVMWLTKAPDYGIVQFSVNGNPVGEPVDLYAERVEPSGPVRVGMFTPTGRETTVRVEIVGRNARSRGAFAGIDAVKLEAAW